MEQYSNRPHRSDRPFGFDGHEEHVGFNHYDRFEQELSEREKRIKKEEIDSGSETQVTHDKLIVQKSSHFLDLCASQQDVSGLELQFPLDLSKPKIKQEVSDDTHCEKNIFEFKSTLPKFEAIFDYSVLDANPGFDVVESKLKLEDMYADHCYP